MLLYAACWVYKRVLHSARRCVSGCACNHCNTLNISVLYIIVLYISVGTMWAQTALVLGAG